MRYIFLLIFGIATAEVIAKRRLRRQILPSKHIQVHSLDSKVLLDDVSNLITVDSPDSRVELSEKNVNGTIWAEKSKVQFDSYDTFVNATAEVAQSIMNILNCAFIHGFSLESTLFMVTNRTADGHTYLNHQMYDNANVSIRDEGVQIQGIGGRRVGVEAQTWDKYLEKTMTLTAVNNNENGDRELMLSIVAPQYKIDVCFVGAMIYIEFGDKLVQIDPDFTSVNIYTSKYLINFRTKDLVTPYDIKLTNEQIIIRCPQEQTSVFVQPDGVNVNVEEFNKMQLDRGGGEMILGGHAMHADSVRVISLSALLNLANNGHIRADTTKSEILVQTPVQNVGLTARHHDIQVLGGVPRLLIEAGMACVEVTSSIGMPESIHLIPPFAPPEDRYLTIGPYQGKQSAYSASYYTTIVNSPFNFAPPPIAPTQNENTHFIPIPAQSQPPPGPPPIPTDLMGFAADIKPVAKQPNNSSIPVTSKSKSLDDKIKTKEIETQRNITEDFVNPEIKKQKQIQLPFDLSGFAGDLVPVKKIRNETDIEEITTSDEISKNITDIMRNNLASDAQNGTTDNSSILRDGLNETDITDELNLLINNTKSFSKTGDVLIFQNSSTSSTTSTTTATLTTTSTTTTTTVPPTTTVLSELDKLKAEIARLTKIREWQTEENNEDNDGDTKEETFTYPNGTTVTRLINIKRKITTKIVHKHRQEVEADDNSTIPLTNAKIVGNIKTTFVEKDTGKILPNFEKKIATTDHIATTTSTVETTTKILAEDFSNGNEMPQPPDDIPDPPLSFARM